MQVLVNRSELMASNQDAVPVIGSYDDGVKIPSVASNVAVLSLPSDAVVFSAPNYDSGPISPSGLANLVKGWREAYKQQIASAEASSRILAVFPEYSQRNSDTELIGYIAQYGADSSKWPGSPQARKTEIDRCWKYVNAVRGKYTAMVRGALPADPTADSQWPTRIAPYQPLQ